MTRRHRQRAYYGVSRVIWGHKGSLFSPFWLFTPPPIRPRRRAAPKRTPGCFLNWSVKAGAAVWLHCPGIWDKTAGLSRKLRQKRVSRPFCPGIWDDFFSRPGIRDGFICKKGDEGGKFAGCAQDVIILTTNQTCILTNNFKFKQTYSTMKNFQKSCFSYLLRSSVRLRVLKMSIIQWKLIACKVFLMWTIWNQFLPENSNR